VRRSVEGDEEGSQAWSLAGGQALVETSVTSSLRLAQAFAESRCALRRAGSGETVGEHETKRWHGSGVRSMWVYENMGGRRE
jgi:hypothetical protein